MLCRFNGSVCGDRQSIYIIWTLWINEHLPELEELLQFVGYPHCLPAFFASSSSAVPPLPDKIQSNSEWSLEFMTKVSRHSTIFRFASKDRARGTPHVRVRGSRPQPNNGRPQCSRGSVPTQSGHCCGSSVIIHGPRHYSSTSCTTVALYDMRTLYTVCCVY